MSRGPLTALIASVALVSASLDVPLRAAQQSEVAAGSGVGRVSRSTVNGTSVITGQTLNADRSPLASARVRLRNLDKGTIDAVTTSDHLGEFSFVVTESGTYLAEMFDDEGNVVVVGEVMVIQAGQAIGTILILPSRALTLAGLFGNSAAAIASAAAGAGLTAFAATGTPASPER